MFKIKNENDMIQCPYNISHQIIRHRFQVHLVRCRKSYPKAEVTTCPFNITHRINKQELEWHVSTCVDRQSFENFKSNITTVVGLSTTINNTFCGNESANQTANIILETAEIETYENWDEMPDVPSYDAKGYAEKAQIYRLPVGMPPAQRKMFRVAERKRLQALMQE